MRRTGNPETSVRNDHSTQRNIPEERISQRVIYYNIRLKMRNWLYGSFLVLAHQVQHSACWFTGYNWHCCYVVCWYDYELIFIWRDSPHWARSSSFTRFLDHSNDAQQSVGLLWTSDQLAAETSTWQHTTLTADIIHALYRIRTHNLSRRASADLRLRPRGYWNRHYACLHANILYKSADIIMALK